MFERDGKPYRVDYAAMARAFGARGVMIESADELGPALREALASDLPTVIQAPMENAPTPTPGHWDINDIYRRGRVAGDPIPRCDCRVGRRACTHVAPQDRVVLEPQAEPAHGAREQLERMLAQRHVPAGRPAQALPHVHRRRRRSAGARAELKEYVIGVQVFRKEDSFDPRTDPDRARAGPAAAREARALLPRRRPRRRARSSSCRRAATRRSSSSATTPVLAQPLDRRPRSSAATRSRSCRSPTTAPARDLGVLLPGRARRNRASPRAACRACAMLRARPATPTRRARATATRRGADHRRQRASSRATRCASTVHLVDGASGCYLWSESVDARRRRCVRRAGARGRRRSSSKLEPELLERRRRAGVARPAENLAAQNLYLQGRYHLNQRTEEGLRKALDFFEKALVEDAQYALAHSGLADAYGLLGALRRARPGRGLDEGGVAARRRR